MHDCVIIGGGPAGLTAAYELTKLGKGSVVLEQDKLVGGISRTVEYEGYRFDIGGHRFFTKVPYVQELWVELLDEEFMLRPRMSRIHYNGIFFDYPLRPVGALRGLGPIEAVRIMASFVRSNLFPYKPERNFEEWVSNRFGRRLFQIFFKTYTEKVWGMPCSEISADWAAQRIKNLDLVSLVKNALLGAGRGKNQITTLIEEFQYPRHGPGQMWETCVQRLAKRGVETQLKTSVETLHHNGERVTHVTVKDADGERTVEGDNFLSTMPVRTLLHSLSPLPPQEILDAADRLRYRDFLTVGLIIDREELFPDNWIYIHSPDVKLGRIQNFKNWSPHMVPDLSKTSLGLEYFVQEGDEVWDMADDDLIALGTKECELLKLIPPDSVIDGTVIRMPKAYPVYDDIYQEALTEIRAWLSGLPNLQLIGRNGQHRYNNQDHSMVTAVYAARNIAAGREEYDVWDVNVEDEYHEEKRAGEGDTKEAKGASGERMIPRRVEAPATDALVKAAFAQYDARALGLATGIVAALLVVAVTTLQLLLGSPEMARKVGLMGQFLPSYTISWAGAAIGAVEIAAIGFLVGWLLAKAINILIRLEEQNILGQIESGAVDLLDRDK